MIRLRGRDAVVLHVPKTGGTSIRYALDPYAGEPTTPLPPKTVAVPLGWAEKSHFLSQHASAAAVAWAEPGLVSARFYAFIRNPWDRYVSAFRFFRMRDRAPYAKMTFSEFAASGWDPHQCRYIDGAHEAIVLCYEDLQAGVDRICDENELPRVELPHYKSGPPVDYREWYSPEDRDAVAKACALDIEMMGYEFG